MRRKILQYILICVMTGVMFTGCGSNEEKKKDASSAMESALSENKSDDDSSDQPDEKEDATTTEKADTTEKQEQTTEKATSNKTENEKPSKDTESSDQPTEDKTPADNTQAAHKHNYTSKITKEATCTVNGVITYTCDCGDSYTEDLPRVDHTSSDWTITKAATCTKEGTKIKTCTTCGIELDSAVIAKTGHSESGWVTVTEATCSSNGLKHKTCTVCGIETASETITSNGSHNYYWDGDNTTRTHKCSGCSYVGITEYNINGAWGYYDDNAAATLWNYVNIERNKAITNTEDDWGNATGVINVPYLILSNELNSKAKNRAAEVATNFSHGSNTDECLAWGQGSPEAAMDAWIGSYNHMKGITNSEYVYGGIACFWYDSDNSGTNLTPIWVLEMSRN